MPRQMWWWRCELGSWIAEGQSTAAHLMESNVVLMQHLSGDTGFVFTLYSGGGATVAVSIAQPYLSTGANVYSDAIHDFTGPGTFSTRLWHRIFSLQGATTHEAVAYRWYDMGDLAIGKCSGEA